MISKSSSRNSTKKNIAKEVERAASPHAIAFSLNRGRTGLDITANGATALVLAVALGGGSVIVLIIAAVRMIH